MSTEKLYIGIRRIPSQGTGSDTNVSVVIDGVRETLDPVPSQKLSNHSPDGFSWGYRGSGPAQLALAILLDATGNPHLSLDHCQRFKDVFVSSWDEDWTITQADVLRWLAQASCPN